MIISIFIGIFIVIFIGIFIALIGLFTGILIWRPINTLRSFGLSAPLQSDGVHTVVFITQQCVITVQLICVLITVALSQ